MSASNGPSVMRVLIVSGSDDEAIGRCAQAIRDQGVEVEHVGDVYAATARLAGGAPIHTTLLDVRFLDDREFQFCRVAARYFPEVDLIVPLFDGVERRLPADDSSPRTASPESIAALFARKTGPLSAPSEMGESAAPDGLSPESGPEDADAPVAAVRPRLSTDGDLPIDGNTPALHEAVRMRMAAGQITPTRRSPPKPSPSVDAGAASLPNTADTDDGDSTLSTDELSALLEREGPARPVDGGPGQEASP